MATYIQGLTQYLPQIQPFQRDYNFYANVMQKKQTEYDSGHEAMNKLYGSIFYSDVSRDDMKERKNELLKAIDFNLKKVSTLDLSLKQNQRQAQQVFRPFYEDQDLMKDIAFTKTYQNEIQKGLSAKDCVGKDCPETYWEGGIRLLEHQMNRFKNSSLEEARRMHNPSYTPYFNIMKEGAKLVKENGFEIVRQGPQGGYMVKEKNGPNAIMSFNDFLFQNFSNDPRAIDFYNAKAQLSFYDNPEETINQYELLKLKQRAKDEEDYKNLVEEHKKEKEFNTAKRNINGAAKIAKDEHVKKKRERLVFQDYARKLGELFTNHPAKEDYDEVVREEQNLERTASELNNLKDNVYGVSYIDNETGQKVPEHVITSVVAQGMLVNETLGVAQSIAMNTYQQTITGADPYAIASYKNKLAKDLEAFKTDQKIIRSLVGDGSSGAGGSSTSISDKDKEKIKKQISDENPGITENELQLRVEEEILQRQTQGAIEKIENLQGALNAGRISQQQLNEIIEMAETSLGEQAELVQDLKKIVTNEVDDNVLITHIQQDGTVINALAQFVENLNSRSKNKKVVESLSQDGEVQKNKITYNHGKSIYNNTLANILSTINKSYQAVNQRYNNIGQIVQQQVLQKVDNLNNLSEEELNSISLLAQSLNINIEDPDQIKTAFIQMQPDEIAKAFVEQKKSSKFDNVTLDQWLDKKNIKIPPIFRYYKGALEKRFEEFKKSASVKPQVKSQIWETLGLNDDLLNTLILNAQNENNINRRIDNFNSQNKRALELNSFNFFKSINLDKSQTKPSNYQEIDFADRSLEKIRELNNNIGNIFYTATSGGAMGMTAPRSAKQNFKELLFNMYPTQEKKDINDDKSVVRISSFEESLGNFITDHVQIDNNQAKVSNFLHNLLHFKELNPTKRLDGPKNYTSQSDEELTKEVAKAFSNFSNDIRRKMFESGLVIEKNNELYFHDILIDLSPNDETKLNILHKQLKNLTTYGSKNNVYSSFYEGQGNDWTNAGMLVQTSIDLNNYNSELLNNLKDVLNEASSQIRTSKNVGTSDLGVGFPILAVSDDDDLSSLVNSDDANRIVHSLSKLFDPTVLKNIAKKDATQAPNITFNTITTSSQGAGYATVEIDLTNNRSDVLKNYGIITQSAYNNSEDLKKEADKKDYTIMPDKFKLTLLKENVPYLQKAASSNNILGMQAGDKYGDLKKLNYEAVIKDVKRNFADSNAPLTVTYELKYITYREVEKDGQMKLQPYVEKVEMDYPGNSMISFEELMMEVNRQAAQLRKNPV